MATTQRNKAWYAKNREKKLEYERRKCWHKTTIYGDKCRAYRITDVSLAIGKPMHVIVGWERIGLIPPTIFPFATRFYTARQLNLLSGLVSILTKAGVRRITHKKVQAPLQAHRVKMFHQWSERGETAQHQGILA